jgi:2-polyprenyl-6-methoxyphenol hydroxylase-like FAD-dependent oxidoreductase
MTFDVITVGGGLAGSALDTALARSGHKVLVWERETRFKDRVRGDFVEHLSPRHAGSTARRCER